MVSIHPQSVPSGCAKCDQPAEHKCGRCKVARYCNLECQRDHWPTHKAECKKLVAAFASFCTGASVPLPNDPPAAAVAAAPQVDATDLQRWSQGLSASDSYEWLTNCYQMRCDDDYAWGGGNLHGPYNPEATPMSITLDFIMFCDLARHHRVVPARWPWAKFLAIAVKFVAFAFEKSDAQVSMF